jgi:hypothetical protein
MAMLLERVDQDVMAGRAVSEGVIVDDAAVGGTGVIDEDGKLREEVEEVHMDDVYIPACSDGVIASTVSELFIV